LAEWHPLAEYLRLIAGLCQAQQQDFRRSTLCLRHSTRSALKPVWQHGLPPFAADSLIARGRMAGVSGRLAATLCACGATGSDRRVDDIAGR
jgi:formate dehydrogenase maturation protein FdhE